MIKYIIGGHLLFKSCIKRAFFRYKNQVHKLFEIIPFCLPRIAQLSHSSIINLRISLFKCEKEGFLVDEAASSRQAIIIKV
ncbi:hypothetical protein CQ043_10990 [Paenibacillus sp. MYb63]|nr:hypothetical protein CQ043_10990 [Paenibacillus sp. MYb63]PRA51508.1 hypothetical protein CQ061_04145 [Paenibacillus sp. MYb67]